VKVIAGDQFHSDPQTGDKTMAQTVEQRLAFLESFTGSLKNSIQNVLNVASGSEKLRGIDHEILGGLVDGTKIQNDAILEHHVRIALVLASVGALIAAHPNKDVIETTFRNYWEGLGGFELWKKLAPERIEGMRSVLGYLGNVAFPPTNTTD
jgi:hypothetical protein